MAEISSYLSERAPEAVANRIVGDIGSSLDILRDFPASDAPRGYIRPGLRMITRHEYVIYYRATPVEIVVVAILHGSRDVEAIVAEGGFEE